MKLLLVSILNLMTPILLLAQESTGSVYGRIMDNSTNEPLVGANVIVVGTNYGAATSFDGEYLITGLPPNT
ncbi:MAG: carboxypeptidase-like regulatory domain-containing protein, partial [Ignavibacteriaceae bacterium]|nr:carboxypeptidase-like regulatory domain-containing protein [Ignavibacteriaceae bacterium]